MRSGKIKTTKKDRVGVTHIGGSRRGALNESRWVQAVKASDLPGIENIATYIKNGQANSMRRLERPGRKIIMSDVLDCNMNRTKPHERYGADDSKDMGLFYNCGKCANTLALRALGWDVQAGRTALGTLDSATQYYWDGAIPYKEKSVQNIVRRMAGFGNKGSGVLGSRRADGSGHAVYFQNEKGPDGKYRPVIYDGQIGKRYEDVEEYFRLEGFDDSLFSTITRTDIATPNWDHLAEDSVVRTNFKNASMNVVKDSRTGTYYNADQLQFTR